MAAFNICGVTIHSASQLPVRDQNNQPLKANRWYTYKLACVTSSNHRWNVYAWTTNVCVDWQVLATGNRPVRHAVWQHFSILIGDFGQLSPVVILTNTKQRPRMPWTHCVPALHHCCHPNSGSATSRSYWKSSCIQGFADAPSKWQHHQWRLETTFDPITTECH